MSKLRGLYFPFSRCTNANTLKLSLLFFDEVYFTDSLSEYDRESLMHHFGYISPTVRLEWQGLKSTYEELQYLDIVKIVDPTQLIDAYDQLLTQAIVTDLHNNALRQKSILSSEPTQHYFMGKWVDKLIPEWRGTKWVVLKNIIPKSAFSHLREIHKEFTQAQQEDLADRNERYEVDAINSIFDEETVKFRADHSELRDYSFLVMGPRESREIVIPDSYKGAGFVWDLGVQPVLSTLNNHFLFILGSCLHINQALLLCEKRGFIPFTDSEVHQQILDYKYGEAIDFTHAHGTGTKIISSAAGLQQFAFLGLNSILRAIPDEKLSSLSFQDVLSLRKACSEDLFRFREYVEGLTAELENEPWSPSLKTEIDKMIVRKVVPELRKLEDELQKVGKKFVRDVFSTVTSRALTTATSTFVASLFTGLTYEQILTLGTASVAIALGLSVPEFVNLLEKKEELRKNSLSYLIKVGQFASFASK